MTETRSREATDYVNTLVARRAYRGRRRTRWPARCSGNRAMRLIRIDGFRVEAVPEGYFLMLHNRDVPGVVGAVGTMLGQAESISRGWNWAATAIGGTALSLVASGRTGSRRGPRQAPDASGDHVGVFAETLKPRLKL